MTPTHHAAVVASEVLAKASLLDSTIPKPDRNVVAAWAEVLGDDIDRADALAAVEHHYGTSRERLLPADVRAYARRCAVKRAEAEHDTRVLQQARALPPAAGDAAAGGDTSEPCDGCGALAGEPCVNPQTGRPRRVPCLARLRTGHEKH